MNACPECAGELKYDPSQRRYVCKSCGLALNRDEIDELKSKYGASTPEEEKEKMKKDYLKWWSTKK
ncbi:MAG: transposase [Candidatus Methanomethylicia archaeon]|nr:transposase [Candidatus Methanomethylicia archaeon]